jgi:hypothetical protein
MAVINCLRVVWLQLITARRAAKALAESAGAVNPLGEDVAKDSSSDSSDSSSDSEQEMGRNEAEPEPTDVELRAFAKRAYMNKVAVEMKFYLDLTKDMQFKVDDSDAALRERLKDNPLVFWKKHRPQGWDPVFKGLLSDNPSDLTITSMLTGKLYSAPGTSADVERVFSVAGDIVTDRRCRLSPDTVSNMVFCAENLSMLSLKHREYVCGKDKTDDVTAADVCSDSDDDTSTLVHVVGNAKTSSSTGDVNKRNINAAGGPGDGVPAAASAKPALSLAKAKPITGKAMPAAGRGRPGIKATLAAFGFQAQERADAKKRKQAEGAGAGDGEGAAADDCIIVSPNKQPRLDVSESVLDMIEKKGRETFACDVGDVLTVEYKPKKPNQADKKFMGEKYKAQVVK